MTITVYRCRDGQIRRQELADCYLEVLSTWQQNPEFFLVVPGDRQQVFPGDRIFPGIGPQVTDWARFVPGLVPELLVATYAKPYFLDGSHHHTEAGN